jgi:hypothetical protein
VVWKEVVFLGQEGKVTQMAPPSVAMKQTLVWRTSVSDRFLSSWKMEEIEWILSTKCLLAAGVYLSLCAFVDQ